MLPQDGRSPYQQQRWFEIINDDEGNAIPPWGVCEVVSNEVVSNGVDGERTVLHVKRPTKDGLPNVILNGLMPIPAAVNLGGNVTKSSGMATRDYPAFAIGEGMVGDMMGSQKDAFALKPMVPGFIVLGNGRAADGTVRVMYFNEALIFTATLAGSLCPSDATASITGVKLIGSCKSLDTVNAAKNPYALSGPNGSKVKGYWNCDTMQWELDQVQHRDQQVLVELIPPSGCDNISEQYILHTSLMYCGAIEEKAVIPLYNAPVVTDVQLANTIDRVSGVDTGDCKLQANVQSICSFVDPSTWTPNWVDKVPFSSVPVINNITQSGLNINGTYVDVFVPCYSAPYDQLLLTLEDCPTGSGSGSGSTG